MKSPQFFKFRILFTQIFSIIFFAVLIFSASRWEENFPAFSEALFAAGILLVGIASMGRMWCSVYIAGRKTECLVTTGPYSITRNPLYFFSFLGMVGVGLLAESIAIPLLLIVLFSVYYPVVIKNEEKILRELHGKPYEIYMRSVPRFFPKFSLFNEPDRYIIFPAIYRKHIFSALWFVWVAGFLDLLEGLHRDGLLPIYFRIF